MLQSSVFQKNATQRRKRRLLPSRRSVPERNLLVEANQGLIGLALQKPAGRLLVKLHIHGSYYDTFQALQFYLIRAAELWDETKEFTDPRGKRGPVVFTTFAMKALKNGVLRGLEMKRVIQRSNTISRTENKKTKMHVAAKMLVGRDLGDTDQRIDLKEVWCVRLHHWLGALRRRDRVVVMLVYFQGLNFADISREIGVTRERVRQLYGRGMSVLRRVAGKECLV